MNLNAISGSAMLYISVDKPHCSFKRRMVGTDVACVTMFHSEIFAKAKQDYIYRVRILTFTTFNIYFPVKNVKNVLVNFIFKEDTWGEVTIKSF